MHQPAPPHPTRANTPSRLWPFVGRTDVHAVQRPDGSYLGNVRQPITEALLASHLAGEVTLGAYTTSAEGLARFLCVDLDADGSPEGVEQARQEALRLVRCSSVPLLIEFSGSKGWHVWGLLTEPVPWTTAAGAARAILEEADGWTVSGSKARHESGLAADLFPQGLGSGGLGKLVKLPLGVHRKTGRRSYFVDQAGEPIAGVPPFEPVPPAALPTPSDPVGEVDPSAIRRRWDGEQLPWFEWMTPLVLGGFPEGFRNRGLYLAASWLVTRTDFSPEEIVSLVRDCADQCSPPMELREVSAVIRSAGRRPHLGLGLEDLAGAGLWPVKGLEAA